MDPAPRRTRLRPTLVVGLALVAVGAWWLAGAFRSGSTWLPWSFVAAGFLLVVLGLQQR